MSGLVSTDFTHDSAADKVRDLVADPDDRILAATIVALGHQMSLVVVAEGVETFEQAEILRGLGCILGRFGLRGGFAPDQRMHDGLEPPFAELDVGEAVAERGAARAFEHRRRHVHADDAAGGPHARRGQEGVEARAGTQVQHRFSGLQ